MSNSSAGSTVTLEQLISLNDEMAALVRAGVPLEQGLLELSRDLPGRAGRIAEVLGRRMSAGESLPQILARESDQFPPIWRAVVEAGLRSGELSAALESMSTTARRMAEMRKLIGAALIYPLMVLALAYAVFVFQVTRLIPVMSRTYADLTGDTDALLTALTWIGDTAIWWASLMPIAIVLLVGAWWYRSSRVIWSRRQRAGTRWSRGWLRGASVRQTLCNGRMAAFAEVLSLLVKQRVPLQEAIVLAADASGDGSIRHASREIADRLQRGEVIVRRENLPAPFPPLLGWMLVTGGRQPELGEALRRTAAAYRERAERSARWAAIYLPIVLTVILGGTATLIQGLVTFLPFSRLLYDLGRPVL